jgi:hypothetical protein
VLEFIAELTPSERHVYALEAEGMRYRAIAPVLGVEVNEARRVSRSLASKRQRFQLLYDTGRMCGYRAPTIRGLIAGAASSEALAQAAFAHLESCARCRAEHRTNAGRLRVSFQERAAALLPLPALAGHLGLLARLDLRARSLTHRWLPGLSGGAGTGVRERAITAAAGSGVAAKLAAAGATVAVIAGGTLGASAPHSRPRHSDAAHPIGAARSASAASSPAPAVASARMRVPVPSPAIRETPSTHATAPAPAQVGFAFLGLPADGAPASARARMASTRSPQRSRVLPQNGGGPFSP